MDTKRKAIQMKTKALKAMNAGKMTQAEYRQVCNKANAMMGKAKGKM